MTSQCPRLSSAANPMEGLTARLLRWCDIRKPAAGFLTARPRARLRRLRSRCRKSISDWGHLDQALRLIFKHLQPARVNLIAPAFSVGSLLDICVPACLTEFFQE